MSTSSLNGIPLTSVSSLLDAIQADPSKADTTWTASTTWSQQLLARNTIRTHSLTLDEPASLGGTDGGANPVEHVLGAFGSCLVVGYVLNASVRGITVNALRVEVQGKLDLQPFLGLAQGNAGFTSITADVHLDADASEEDLQALHEHVQRTSPVGNVLRRALPVSTKYVQRDDAPTPVDVQEHNGVPVEAVTGLVEAVKADVGKADTTWKAVSTWTGSGLTVQNVVRSHEYQLDEPKSLGGSNAGPNMVEVLLAAYGSCLTVGIVLAATTRGIDLQSLTIDTKGELDLHPFLGLAEGNAGFSSVTAGIDLRAASQDVTSQQLDELLEYVVVTSPVGSILSRALDVQINLVASQ